MIFFIDPMSYHNLAIYDYEILSRINSHKILFLGNKLYDYKKEKLPQFFPIFKYSKQKTGTLKLISYTKSLLTLFLYVSKFRPEALHIEWLKFELIDIPFYRLIKKLFNIRIAYTAHNILPHNSGLKKYKSYKRFYRICDYIFVHTESSKKEISKKFNIKEDKIIVVPHGPIQDNAVPADLNNEIDNIVYRYNLKDKIVFSILGVQSKYKGTQILLDAWSKVKNDNAVLIVAGRPDGIDLAANVSTDLIIIPKELSAIEMCALFTLTNVLVLPYIQISQSGVLLSAINYGVPFIASNAGELQKPLDMANIGWKLSENTPEILASLLHKIIKAPETIKEKKENYEGWALVKKVYSWDENASITSKVYERLSQEKPI